MTNIFSNQTKSNQIKHTKHAKILSNQIRYSRKFSNQIKSNQILVTDVFKNGELNQL